MALGGLKVLPSKLVILLLIVLYLRNLVAIVDKKQPELQGERDDVSIEFSLRWLDLFNVGDSLLRDGDSDIFQV